MTKSQILNIVCKQANLTETSRGIANSLQENTPLYVELENARFIPNPCGLTILRLSLHLPYAI